MNRAKKTFIELIDQNTRLSQDRDRLDDQAFVERAGDFLIELTASGEYISDVKQRDLLAISARTWAKELRAKTGRFYGSTLASFRPETVEAAFQETAAFEAPVKVELDRAPAEPKALQPRSVDWVAPAAAGDETPVPLEPPTGAVPLDSRFYVEREADRVLTQRMQEGRMVIAIRGGHQTGKTSLLLRGLDRARRRHVLPLHLDFRRVFGPSELLDANRFFQCQAFAVADRAHADLDAVDRLWATGLSSQEKLTRVLETILGDVEQPVLLAMDQSDILFDTPFYSEFFALIRSWHEQRAFDQRWRKLSILMTISIPPHLLAGNPHRSPFNVGSEIELRDFGPDQVSELNQLHGSPLKPGEVDAALELLGGHPYLTRQALYTLVTEKIEWPDLAATASSPEGPFGGHLESYLHLLPDEDELMDAMRAVLESKTCPPDQALVRMRAAGLIREENGECRCRYLLYERFFRERMQ